MLRASHEIIMGAISIKIPSDRHSRVPVLGITSLRIFSLDEFKDVAK